MNKLLKINKSSIILFSMMLLAPHVISQEDKFDAIMENLNEGKESGKTVGKDDGPGYKSFVQNELQNIFSQLSAIETKDKEDLSFQEINTKRIELATKLCTQDERACFLIEEYRSYTSKLDMPSTFDELKIFGHDIFSGYSNDFNFYDSLPISSTYVIKIGDILEISLFGGLAFEGKLKVDMNGSIVIPSIGRFQVAGLSYSAVDSLIKTDISKKYAGTEAYISLDRIRSKQVFVLGNVKLPGTYAINAFGTALNALISSGGVKPNSSLRKIQVIRKGNSVKEIDLYSLLIDGDVSASDFVLNDGDSLLIDGLESSVSILGEVIRPSIYELSDDDTLEDAIEFALGTTPFADKDNISVERMLPSGERTILKPEAPSKFSLENGDRIVVNSSFGQKINSVSVSGAVRNTGEYSLETSTNLGDIIKVQRDLLSSTYTGYAILKRLNFASKSFRLISFNLSNQDEIDKVGLASGDEVYIFSTADILYMQSQEVYDYLQGKLSNTQNTLNLDATQDMPLEVRKMTAASLALVENKKFNACLTALDVLTEQPISKLVSAKLKIFPAKNQAGGCTELLLANTELLPILLINSVPVSGNVRFPGLYPTSRELNGLDLFNIAGGFLLSKLNVAPTFDIGIRGRGFGTFQFNDLVDLTNITMLTLRINRGSLPEGYIKLVGEFKNPGIYPISKGSTLSEIYNRAGGLTAQAYPLGGILTRESIQLLEEQGLERSKAELSEILASAAASGFLKQNSTDLVGLIALMTTISNARPAGRLVTELNPAKFKDSPTLDVVLEDGDAIYIPEIQNTITIVGQVLNPVTVPHKVGASFNDYIEYAGGLKKDADKSKIYAVLPNGISKRRQKGFSFPIVFPGTQFQKSDILPGSTIIIPRKARPLDSLTLVETVTPILANLSVTAASIAAISD
jgi:protein involved in polysaccharide export with SLBB domain